MKSILLLLALIVLFCDNCKKPPVFNLAGKGHRQVIAFQPFDDFIPASANSVFREIGIFFNLPVVVLKPVAIPGRFLNTDIFQYSADSLLLFLSKLRNDSILEVVGLTQLPVFTLKERNHVPYFDENIFGMGYQPGIASIVSDYSFYTPDRQLFHHRLENVILHEMGHNLGLAHCADDICIMSTDNGNIELLDKSSNNYCARCGKILAHLRR